MAYLDLCVTMKLSQASIASRYGILNDPQNLDLTLELKSLLD